MRKFLEIESKLMIAEDQEKWGKQGEIANGYGKDCKKIHSFFGVMKIFQN